MGYYRINFGKVIVIIIMNLLAKRVVDVHKSTFQPLPFTIQSCPQSTLRGSQRTPVSSFCCWPATYFLGFFSSLPECLATTPWRYCCVWRHTHTTTASFPSYSAGLVVGGPAPCHCLNLNFKCTCDLPCHGIACTNRSCY